jgi:hypothetical protein
MKGRLGVKGRNKCQIKLRNGFSVRVMQNLQVKIPDSPLFRYLTEILWLVYVGQR